MEALPAEVVLMHRTYKDTHQVVDFSDEKVPEHRTVLAWVSDC